MRKGRRRNVEKAKKQNQFIKKVRCTYVDGYVKDKVIGR